MRGMRDLENSDLKNEITSIIIHLILNELRNEI